MRREVLEELLDLCEPRFDEMNEYLDHITMNLDEVEIKDDHIQFSFRNGDPLASEGFEEMFTMKVGYETDCVDEGPYISELNVKGSYIKQTRSQNIMGVKMTWDCLDSFKEAAPAINTLHGNKE